MKKYIFFMIIFFACNLKAEDTTNVRVHNAVDMTWYGNYDQWGVFPDGSKTYRKIYLQKLLGIILQLKGI